MATTRMNRMVKGFHLYQHGRVEQIHEDEELLQFEVQSNKQIYEVTFDLHEGTVICNPCQDYYYREPLSVGSFFCKHISAAWFKLAELRGVRASQTTLASTPVKKVI